MQKRTLAALVAALCLGAAAGQASANQLSLSEQRFRLTWTSLELGNTGGAGTVRCAVTLSGSFHSRTVQKVVNALVGHITGGTLGACSGGTARLHAETLPWHVRYASFTGTLPAITGIGLRVVGATFSVTPSGFSACTARTSEAAPARFTVNVSGGRVTGVTADPTATIPLTGSFLCSFASGRLAGTAAATTPAGSAIAVSLIAAPPPPPVWIVSVGDSFISGEGGRWAGNTALAGREATIDTGGAGVYAGGTCHRSASAEIHIGTDHAGRTVNSENLACSGARTTTPAGGPPGLDFAAGAVQGQAAALQAFAAAHPAQVRLVVVAIGGNDFSFGDVVRACVRGFHLFNHCHNDSWIEDTFEAANVATQTDAIRAALLRVRQAMTNAGYADADYRLLVQNYMSLVPEPADHRYPGDDSDRITPGGCGLYDADITWANTVAIPTINGAIWEAVRGTGLTNVKRLELRSVFNGRRLCEGTVDLLENSGLTAGTDDRGADLLEWVNHIREDVDGTQYAEAEEVHPNNWGQRALRACVRLAYNGGAPVSGTCTIAATGGITVRREPAMQLAVIP